LRGKRSVVGLVGLDLGGQRTVPVYFLVDDRSEGRIEWIEDACADRG
jgi:hypothetical protein